MDHSKLPQFEIKESKIIDCKLHLQINLIKVTKTIGEGLEVFILINDEYLINGDLFNVDLKTMKCNLISFLNFGKAVFVKPGFYSYLDGYWGERAQVVLDKRFQWRAVEFKLKDSVMHYPDGSVRTIKDGWNHEHCSVCWATISLNEKTVYMQGVSDDKRLGQPRLCMNCYKNYSLKKDLSFIVTDQL